MRTLGQYLIDALAACGVRYVFGIPGVHNLELYRGLAQSSIRHVNGRHEQGLGFMADGYARVSGRPGVCFTITGPGLTNILTAMGQAYGDSIPLLVISSQNARGEGDRGCGFLHELPRQREMAAGLSAAAFSIGDPAELPGALERAFDIFAAARPRPVYIEIPLDVLGMQAGDLPLPNPTARPPQPPLGSIDSAVAFLRAARRPVMIVGGGGVRAVPEVKRMAELLDAPVVMTANARGVLAPDHPLAVPMSPMLAPVRSLIADAAHPHRYRSGTTDSRRDTGCWVMWRRAGHFDGVGIRRAGWRSLRRGRGACGNDSHGSPGGGRRVLDVVAATHRLVESHPRYVARRGVRG